MKRKKNRLRQKRPIRRIPGVGARALVRWPYGLDGPPEILPMGDTDIESEQIRAVLMKALKLKPAQPASRRHSKKVAGMSEKADQSRLAVGGE